MKLRFSNTAQSCLDFLTSPDQNKYRLARGFFYGILFLGGLYLLGHFLAWGSVSLEFADWAEVAGPRLTLLQNAILHAQPPLVSASPLTIGGATTYQILAVPDLLISPQVFLLVFMSAAQFYVFQVLLMYAIGFLGLVQLSRRKNKNYSPLTFSIVFILFNFNGYILAHFSIGHLTWGAYFLFSWLAVLVFDLLDGRSAGWVWTFKMAGLLFIILLQGGYHHVVYCLFLLGLLGLTYPRHFWLILKTSVFAVLLSLARLLPLVLLVKDVSNNYLTGFPDIVSVWNALVVLQGPNATLKPIAAVGTPIGGWESTLYTGLVGALFIVYFGLIRPLVRPESPHSYRRLLLPLGGLLFMSLTPVYSALRQWIPLPLFTGERVTTRLVGLVLALILFLAANEFQEWLNEKKDLKIAAAGSLVLLALGLADLYQNYFYWTVARVHNAFPFKPFNPDQWTLTNDLTGRVYLDYILLGAVGTLTTFIFLVFMVRREHQAKSKKL